MTSLASAPSPAHVTVGWIAILKEEMYAAEQMMDEIFGTPALPHDRFPYVVGRVGNHYVALAQVGESSPPVAADRVGRMLNSFPMIEFLLLVGIGGGLRSRKHDIRLGDVVVSKCVDGHSGVVAYDGEKLTDAGIKKTRAQNRPPDRVMYQVDRSELQQDRGQLDLRPYLRSMTDRNYSSRLHLQDDPGDKWHPPRPEAGSKPQIHYGLIASGSLVVRTAGPELEKLLKRVDGDVLCFEMEAAALMNRKPTLVVRGVNDYSNPKKNDKWKRYASATAACYARYLLEMLPPAYDRPVLRPYPRAP